MELKQLIAEVKAANTIEWYRSPAPNRYDLKCLAIGELLRGSPEPARAAPFDDPAFSVRIQLFVFRMVELSVRTRSVDLLEAAATMLALQGVVEREAYALLALLYHAAGALSLDGDKFLRGIAASAGPEGRRRILDYVSGDARSKSLGAMGFREVQRADGVHYESDPGMALREALKLGRKPSRD